MPLTVVRNREVIVVGDRVYVTRVGVKVYGYAEITGYWTCTIKLDMGGYETFETGRVHLVPPGEGEDETERA